MRRLRNRPCTSSSRHPRSGKSSVGTVRTSLPTLGIGRLGGLETRRRARVSTIRRRVCIDRICDFPSSESDVGTRFEMIADRWPSLCSPVIGFGVRLSVEVAHLPILGTDCSSASRTGMASRERRSIQARNHRATYPINCSRSTRLLAPKPHPESGSNRTTRKCVARRPPRASQNRVFQAMLMPAVTHLVPTLSECGTPVSAF